jgi:hypothetical protein
MVTWSAAGWRFLASVTLAAKLPHEPDSQRRGRLPRYPPPHPPRRFTQRSVLIGLPLEAIERPPTRISGRCAPVGWRNAASGWSARPASPHAARAVFPESHEG